MLIAKLAYSFIFTTLLHKYVTIYHRKIKKIYKTRQRILTKNF